VCDRSGDLAPVERINGRHGVDQNQHVRVKGDGAGVDCGVGARGGADKNPARDDKRIAPGVGAVFRQVHRQDVCVPREFATSMGVENVPMPAMPHLDSPLASCTGWWTVIAG